MAAKSPSGGEVKIHVADNPNKKNVHVSKWPQRARYHFSPFRAHTAKFHPLQSWDSSWVNLHCPKKVSHSSFLLSVRPFFFKNSFCLAVCRLKFLTCVAVKRCVESNLTPYLSKTFVFCWSHDFDTFLFNLVPSTHKSRVSDRKLIFEQTKLRTIKTCHIRKGSSFLLIVIFLFQTQFKIQCQVPLLYCADTNFYASVFARTKLLRQRCWMHSVWTWVRAKDDHMSFVCSCFMLPIASFKALFCDTDANSKILIWTFYSCWWSLMHCFWKARFMKHWDKILISKVQSCFFSVSLSDACLRRCCALLVSFPVPWSSWTKQQFSLWTGQLLLCSLSVHRFHAKLCTWPKVVRLQPPHLQPKCQKGEQGTSQQAFQQRWVFACVVSGCPHRIETLTSCTRPSSETPSPAPESHAFWKDNVYKKGPTQSITFGTRSLLWMSWGIKSCKSDQQDTKAHSEILNIFCFFPEW